MSETNLVKACEQYLRLKGVFCYRNNTGGMTYEYKGKKGFMRFGAVGSPDIIAVINGQYVGIECKMPKGKQSPGQKEFEKNLLQAGGKYWLIRDVNELIDKFENNKHPDYERQK